MSPVSILKLLENFENIRELSANIFRTRRHFSLIRTAHLVTCILNKTNEFERVTVFGSWGGCSLGPAKGGGDRTLKKIFTVFEVAPRRSSPRLALVVRCELT